MKPIVLGLVAFATGTLLTAGAFTAFPSRAAPSGTPATKEPGEPVDENALQKANQNLTDSLQACDRKLAELREAPPSTPAPTAAREERDAGRFEGRRRERSEPTKEDWERMAQVGMVRTRIPCVRDTPWSPNERAMNRLGLAPGDAETIKDAYAKSNKRVADQIQPLCAKVLGSADVAGKVGVSACMDAIQGSARKTNAEGAKTALSRAAEVQAGKRQVAADASELEQLANVLAGESKAFEADLATKLGPDEAKRLANAPEMCTDRRVLRASDEREDPRERGPRGGN